MASGFPPIFLLPTHLPPSEQHELEDSIPTLTYDINEAEVVLGRISTRERAMFELRRFKVETEPRILSCSGNEQSSEPSPKRRKTSDSATKGGTDLEAITPCGQKKQFAGDVKVLKLAWLTDSLSKGEALPSEPYLLYEGRKIRTRKEGPKEQEKASGSQVLQRGLGDQHERPVLAREAKHELHRKPQEDKPLVPQRPSLIHQTTSEHDLPMPPIPEYLKTTYSCQRPTPANPPNEAFIEALKGIKTIRLLGGDKVGVRAYSTSIATVAAYPYQLQSAEEVSRLPGCGAKIAELYQQFKDLGHLTESRQEETDSKMSTLKLFYNIWGVGDTTAREFYRKGWRDLDDLVEYGWESLSRVQQIGVKYYDEFLLKIPRAEVESIGGKVLDQARKLDPGFQMTIVGGYRRGKKESGDVDIMLSHRDESMTANLIDKMVMELEKSNLITHTLTLSTRNSDRGQAPLQWRGEGTQGSGFDTLDKALVVWKDPDVAESPHRRVDIIVSPWKTVGCAVLGWSGGTTFQRDLRLYCKRERGLKFDSSGIRSRTDGMWVDLESGGADSDSDSETAPDMETAEKRVFAGLGLPWRRPEERCTG